MSSRRTLILLGAIAIGVIAALLLFNYVRGIDNRANDNAKRVDVFSAKTDIKRGTAGEDAVSSGAIASGKIPQEFKPSTAINSTNELQKKVALFDIAQNTVIVQGMFVDPSQTQISFRARLKNPNQVAISISADGVHGVAGWLQPGDEVNILVKAGTGQAASSTDASTGATAEFTAGAWRYLYQSVHILAVGGNALLSPGEQATSTETTATNSGGGLLTVNVPPEAAQWLAQAEEAGMYLSLVPEDYVPRPLPPLDPNVALLPGEDPALLTPYGPQGDQE